MSKISIITFTFNRVSLLPRTIESVLSQSFEDFNYVIINNDSTDETQSVLNHYKTKDKRISVITREKNDVSSKHFIHLQTILKEQDTNYFMQIDDDDYMELSAVDTLYKLITDNNADIATIGSKWVYPDGTTNNKYVFDGTFVFSRIESMIELLKREKFNSAFGGKIYRKHLIENIPVITINPFRDIHKEYRILNNINKMVVTGKPLYYFYRHDSNASGLDTPEQITLQRIRQHLEGNLIRTQWLTEHMPEIKNFVFYCELSFMISLYERIYKLEVSDCFGIAEEMKTTLFCHKMFLSECGFLKEYEKEILENIGK